MINLIRKCHFTHFSFVDHFVVKDTDIVHVLSCLYLISYVFLARQVVLISCTQSSFQALASRDFQHMLLLFMGRVLCLLARRENQTLFFESSFWQLLNGFVELQLFIGRLWIKSRRRACERPELCKPSRTLLLTLDLSD